MTIFEYVTAALLIILGLGVTELLNDAIGLFRDRHERRPEWIALAWACIIFAHQMQFLWAIFELSAIVESWSAGEFLLALSLVLLLFAAGALIIPRPAAEGAWDPWRRFQQNGRWSVIALACYSLLAFTANPLFYGVAFFTAGNIINLVLAGLLLGIFFLPTKRLWSIATVLYAFFAAYEIVRLSPSTYP